MALSFVVSLKALVASDWASDRLDDQDEETRGGGIRDLASVLVAIVVSGRYWMRFW